MARAPLTDTAATVVRNATGASMPDAMRLATGILAVSAIAANAELSDGEVRHAVTTLLSGSGGAAHA